jgi:DNA recombination protein RmuC
VFSRNNVVFLDLAKSVFEKIHMQVKSDMSAKEKSMDDLVNPIKKALENVGLKLGDLEKERLGAYEALKQQVGDLVVLQNSLKTETNNLVTALKSPIVRGRWGEMQLRRVVELAGMTEHCDFEEQYTITDTNEEKTVRPDMIIYLPEKRQIVVDAKAPLSAYLEALETSDDKKRKNLMEKHAKLIRSHISALADKKYWACFEQSPEFVLMFFPGEIFFSVAVEHDPLLPEFAMQQRVIIVTPMILLALLHTAALGWRREKMTEDADLILKTGKELYKRLSDMTGHISKLGKDIHSVVGSYNSTIASLESRVLVSARKFKDMDVHEKNIIEANPVEENVRTLRGELH